jgi:hypothetical protein
MRMELLQDCFEKLFVELKYRLQIETNTLSHFEKEFLKINLNNLKELSELDNIR